MTKLEPITGHNYVKSKTMRGKKGKTMVQSRDGRSPVWGGATLGLIIGLVIGLIRGPIIWWLFGGILIGAVIGLIAQLLGARSDRTNSN